MGISAIKNDYNAIAWSKFYFAAEETLNVPASDCI